MTRRCHVVWETATLTVLALSLSMYSGEDVPAAKRVSKIGDFIQHLSWSPDGKQFLFTRIHKGKMGLWTMNVDGSEVKPLLPKETMPHFDGHWSSDGKKIVFVYDKLQGTDGKLQIDVVNADGTEQKNLIPHKAFEEAPRWSSDGKSIVWAGTREKNQEIFIADADGKNIKRLTNGPPSNSPSWSPDGKEIAFTSGRTGNLDIYVMKADGSDVRRLTVNPTMDYWPVWSPDGKRMAFTSNRDGNYDIYLMNIDGTEQRNLTKHPATDNFAAWSPDGRRLAFISNRGGGYDIYVMEVR
jgi:TolB protein